MIRKKIVHKKVAQDIATLVAMDILNINKKSAKDGVLRDVASNTLNSAYVGGILGALNPSLLGGSIGIGPGYSFLSGLARGAVFGGVSTLVDKGLNKLLPKMNPHIKTGISTATATIPALYGYNDVDLRKSALLTGLISGGMSAINGSNQSNQNKHIKKIVKRSK